MTTSPAAASAVVVRWRERCRGRCDENGEEDEAERREIEQLEPEPGTARRLRLLALPRSTHTHTHTHTETDIQAEIDIHIQTYRQTNTQTTEQPEPGTARWLTILALPLLYTHTDTEIERDTQTDRETDRFTETDRQMDRQTIDQLEPGTAWRLMLLALPWYTHVEKPMIWVSERYFSGTLAVHAMWAKIRTFTRREAVDFVRFLAVSCMQIFHFLDVRRLVERTAQSRLQLCKVRCGVSLAPPPSVTGPLLDRHTQTDIQTQKHTHSHMCKDRHRHNGKVWHGVTLAQITAVRHPLPDR